METSIRYVRVEGNSLKPALCFRGKQRAHAVINDDACVRVVSNISLQQHDKSDPVFFPPGKDPLREVVARFSDAGQRKGITERAKFFLERALKGGVEDDEPLPPEKVIIADRGKLITVEGAPTLGELIDAGQPNPPAGGAPLPRVGAKPATAPRPNPNKPVRSSSGSRSAPVAGTRTAGADIVRKLAAELKLEPTKLRKLLRSKGLSAPYTDEKLIRSKLK